MSDDEATHVVHSLLTQLAAGGDTATEAIRALGLLLEREKVTRPHGDDGGLQQILGPQLAAQRLTLLAQYQAVEALLAKIRAPQVPPVGVVWALGKSFDPRIVPHLVALLERIVDDPAQQDLAEQIVGVLTCFFDARSVEGVRLAAARGVGEARAAAQHWLQLHGQRQLPVVSVRSVARRFELEAEVYRAQRRPGTRQVIVNDGARGLLIVEPDSGGEVGRRIFSDGFDSRQVIRSWCISRDGQSMVVFPDGGKGSIVDLGGKAPPRDIAAPDSAGLHNLRYSWDDNLVVACGNVTTFWKLAHTEARFETLRPIEARRSLTSWVRCLDQFVPLSSRVLRVEPDAHRMVAYDFSVPPGQLVAASWDGGPAFRVAATSFVPAIAYHADRFLLLYDHGVQAVDGTGAVTDEFPAEPGTFLRALDVIPPVDGKPALLVAVGERLGGGSVLTTFELD